LLYTTEHRTMSIDRARLVAHYLALPGDGDPSADVAAQADGMRLGTDGRAPITTALRELFGACRRSGEPWATEPLVALDEHDAAVELVERLRAGGTRRVEAAFRLVAQRSTALFARLQLLGFYAD
jgi:hypothetical protein